MRDPDAVPRTLVSGVILAAGTSSRMGRPKLLLPVGSRPLLQYALDAAADSTLDEIVLVVGDAARELIGAVRLPSRLPVRIAVNDDPAAGQSRSLQVGLRAVDPAAEAAAVLLGDQPGVTGRLIDRVVEAFRMGETPVVRPVYSPTRRRVPGHPVLVARTIWSEVERLRGDAGLRQLLARRPDWLLEVPVDGDPPADVDTPESYRSILEAGAAPD